MYCIVALLDNKCIIHDEDVSFLLVTVKEMSEQIHNIIKYRTVQNEFQIKRYFTGIYIYIDGQYITNIICPSLSLIDLKILLVVYGSNFSLEQWLKISHEMFMLITKFG